MLIAAGALVGFALLAAGLGRFTAQSQAPVGGTPIAVRNLNFIDRPDGGIDVIDTDRHVTVTTVTGQSGFLRGAVRGLASARLRAGLTAAKPFRLTAWKDGRLTLDDLADGRHVELEAFGPANEAVFVDLLNDKEPAR